MKTLYEKTLKIGGEEKKSDAKTKMLDISFHIAMLYHNLEANHPIKTNIGLVMIGCVILADILDRNILYIIENIEPEKHTETASSALMLYIAHLNSNIVVEQDPSKNLRNVVHQLDRLAKENSTTLAECWNRELICLEEILNIIEEYS